MSDNRITLVNTLLAEKEEMFYQNIFFHCNSWMILSLQNLSQTLKVVAADLVHVKEATV
jgi:hypothetical protein